jgi:hypothetical protein
LLGVGSGPEHFPSGLGSSRCRRRRAANWKAQSPWESLTGERATEHSTAQRRALRLLAGSPLGCSEAILLAHGFKTELLAVLVRDGLAITQPGTTRAGRRRLEVAWVMITDAGRRALDQSTR